jgi:aspartate-semialdehyde dehydrogenase
MKGGRLRVGVLGATGVVGQQFVARLAGHPLFELVALFASPRSAGRRYGEAVRWQAAGELPVAAASLPVRTITPESPPEDCDLLFSALDAASAEALEPACVAAGLAVATNASAHRLARGVPLLVPEVNAAHAALLDTRGGRGLLVANPNCATVGLVAVLAPLAARFGVEAVQVTTLQAASGAGYPGVPALDLLGNVLPGIPGEEEKLEREPRRILGRLAGGEIAEAPIAVSAQTHRVPVIDGHLLALSVRLDERASPEEVARAIDEFGQPLASLALPSAPRRLLWRDDAADFPQPRLHAGGEGGMTVAVGRVRRCPLFDVRLSALVHNTVRGAAGGAILNAELLVRTGRLGIRR